MLTLLRLAADVLNVASSPSKPQAAAQVVAKRLNEQRRLGTTVKTAGGIAVGVAAAGILGGILN